MFRLGWKFLGRTTHAVAIPIRAHFGLGPKRNVRRVETPVVAKHSASLHAWRASRVAVAVRKHDVKPRRANLQPNRFRKGYLNHYLAAWRPLTLGTNQISSHGVWRQGARRICPRPNSSGASRWHRPYLANHEAAANVVDTVR
jgi:hypothetical protein